MIEISERLLRRRIIVGECWEWHGAGENSNGYSRMQIAGKRQLVHRIAYTEFVGEIPTDLEIHHTCNNRKCFNPDHLKCVTHKENLLAGDTITGKCARRTYCNHGHEFTVENTWVSPSTGHRRCRTCEATRQRNLKKGY